MARSSHDVLVIGGGPAGAAIARSLAGLGQRAALFASPRRHAAVEGLSERAASALRAAGLARALDTLGPALPRGSTWGGVRVDSGTEHLVERRRFDEALSRDVLDAGVTCLEARCEAWEEHDDGVRVRSRRPDGALSVVEASFLVDARGRSAGLDRDTGLRGPATIALGRAWRRPADRAPGSAIAAFDEGWCWMAAPVGRSTYVQIVLGRESTAIESRATIASGYEAVAARVPELREWLHDASPCSEVEARDATALLGGRLVTRRSLRVGDAAFAPDPLSGQGVFEALATGLAAAAVVNTMLRRPADAELAGDFHRRRIEEAFLRLARVGRDFHRAETRWSEAPFWSARRVWPDDAPVDGAAAPATVATVPVSHDGFIVAREAIVTPGHPRGVWRLDGVELVPLLHFARERSSVAAGRIAAEWSAARALDLAACARALAWLRRRGLG